MGSYLGLFLLSAATLTFEIGLTRILSVAQFYHFAFMIISLALLGFGASGTFLSIFPHFAAGDGHRASHSPVLCGWGFAFTALGSYILMLYLPFDSFRMAHDWRQWLVLALHYIAMASPFFWSGLAVCLLLAVRPEQAGRIYAANLAGSATGCLFAVLAPSLVGGEGTVLLCAATGGLAALAFHWPGSVPNTGRIPCFVFRVVQAILVFALLLIAPAPPTFLELRLSPYKSLSYALLYPDTRLIFRRWNGFSRVDVVSSSAIRNLPGRGFRCPELPPPQLGLTVDGDDLSPISHIVPGFTSAGFTDCLLGTLPYRLRPEARALILEPRGGFDVLVALAEGARHVTAVEANPLIIEAVRAQGEWAGNLYDDPRVSVVMEEGRAYTRRARERFDIIVPSLAVPHRPVTSGAYSLSEDYRYTVEAFTDYLARLDEDGLLVVTRWLQTPPSESVRAFALAVEALERLGWDPRRSIVALRSYQQMLILVRRGAFTGEELQAIRSFAAARAFDLVYLPGLRPDDEGINRYNVLPEPSYYYACTGLLEAQDRDAWYRAYSFDVRPPTDDRPFFGHFFKWRQASQVLAMAGHTWQPFGGAGYFVLLVLLVLALGAAGALIVMPLTVKIGFRRGGPTSVILGYFTLLGLGYLCVEIPVLQRCILFLGHPAYAMATVLFALLLFSGLGSLLSARIPLRPVLLLVPLLVVLYALGLPALFRIALGAPLSGRLLITALVLSPLGLLMGIPFPKGLKLLTRGRPELVAWAWGANGAASVVASVLAALLALSYGFSAVLVLGALAYAGVWIMVGAIRAHGSP